MESSRYENLEEIEAVVHRFEGCEYEVGEFDHVKHLTVAARYLSHSSFELAMDTMRSSLLRFTAHHGVKGYHETITRFWLELLAARLAGPTTVPFPEQVNALIREYADKNVLFEYYNRDTVMSDEAREKWVMPDRKALLRPSSTSLLVS